MAARMTEERYTDLDFAWRHRSLDRDEQEELFREVDALQKDKAALEGFALAFAETAEAAVHHAEEPKGGQKVPFHGDFAHVPPSTVGRLRWWAREARAALAKARGETP